MSSPPEPQPTQASRSQPAVRASDAERETAVLRLRDACGDGRLTLGEFTARLDRVYDSRTRAELAAVTDDLPSARTVPAPARRSSRWIVAVMGGATRKGRWRVQRTTTVLSIMGGADLDLRGALVEDPEIELWLIAVMGGNTVVVPEGVEVEHSGFALMGGDDVQVADVARRPGTPLVRVRSFALMGGNEVKSKGPVTRSTGR